MNEIHNIGDRVSSFKKYNDFGPILGVKLKGTGKAVFVAGDTNEDTLVVECPYATQEMADNILYALDGCIYQGYRATAAPLPKEAELGDAIGVHGVFSVLAYRRVRFGPGHMSEIAAPSDSIADHEYEYVSQYKRKVEKIEEKVEDVQKETEEIKKETEEIKTKVEEIITTGTTCNHPRTNNIDFSKWDIGEFTETLDNGKSVRYTILFDTDGTPIKITNTSDNHECTVVWPV